MKKNLFGRALRKLNRALITHSNNPKPSSHPYISGDSFRAYADMIYDRKKKNVDPDLVKYGTVIFVEIEYAEKFFAEVHPQIKNQYILITHNGDKPVDAKMAKYIDDKIIRWYAMSVLINHPKIIPIPAGLENLSFYNNGIPNLFRKNQKRIPTKKNKILFGFNIATNPAERQPAYDVLIKNIHTEQLQGWPDPKKYQKILRTYMFVASPPGNGIEAHRTWEAMYLRTVPIVKRSIFTEYFESIGMPMWLINSWEEIAALNEKDLIEKYNAIKSKFDTDTLYMDYWIDKINHERI